MLRYSIRCSKIIVLSTNVIPHLWEFLQPEDKKNAPESGKPEKSFSVTDEKQYLSFFYFMPPLPEAD